MKKTNKKTNKKKVQDNIPEEDVEILEPEQTVEKDDGQNVEEDIVKIEGENKNLIDQMLRLRADFDNYRRRMIREKEDMFVQANENLIEELLPVLDHLDLALQSAGGAIEESESAKAFVEGFQMVGNQLYSSLGKFGLESIDATDAEFDPNLHDALSYIPSEDIAENMVINQIAKGYRLGDKLLRPAKVVVSSGKLEVSEEGEE
ncbi:MAG: nucleotide exchange factor GrpE [Kiritimatiellae bacterium]|jgi:molecular chaperone GrpE|nr:nucleotide exchange factor GrpE [Kiritimatiellia bacterium]